MLLLLLTISTLFVECAATVEKNYGDFWNLPLPENAEILEFTPPNSVNPPVVLWSRSNPQVQSGRRGQVVGNSWEVQNVTQSENGFYSLKQKDNTLLSRTQLIVKENIRHYHKVVDEYLIFEYPWDNGAWFVTFQPAGETKNITLIKDGSKYSDNQFGWRLLILSEGPKIDPLESRDAGTYEFRDKEGNMALVAHLEVGKKDDEPAPVPLLVFVGLAGGLLIVCGGFYCYKRTKCCKRDKSAPQTAAAPTMSYHDESQPVGPSYSAVPAVSHQPTDPLQKPTAAP